MHLLYTVPSLSLTITAHRVTRVAHADKTPRVFDHRAGQCDTCFRQTDGTHACANGRPIERSISQTHTHAITGYDYELPDLHVV
jgi:hypothetical protein